MNQTKLTFLRPYKGLAHYEREDASLLAGRNQNILQCAVKLLDSRVIILTLHGETACGKSSFLRAGLVPYIEKTSNRYLVVYNAVITRSSQYPLQRIGEDILSFASKPSASYIPKSDLSGKYLIDRLQRHLGASKAAAQWCIKPDIDAISVHNALRELSKCPQTLILIIDQAEEVFLSKETYSTLTKNYFDFLHLLCIRPLPLRMCISMRSEYKAQFDDELLNRGFLPDRLAGYCLAPLSEEKIVEAILHPTKGWLGAHFKFEYAPGIAKEIAQKVNRLRETQGTKRALLGGVLSTVQVICDRLWDHICKSQSKVIKREDFLALGDPTDQILWHIQESLDEALSKLHRHTPYSIPIKTKQSDAKEAPPQGKSKSRGNTSGIRSAEIDCWLSALFTFAEILSDGRVVSKTLSEEEFLTKLDQISYEQSLYEFERYSHKDKLLVLDHLLEKSEYVLQRIGFTSKGMLVLVHDTIGLVLARWKNEYEAIRPSREVESTDSILSAASFTQRDLYDSLESSLTLNTIDDRIWDHLIAIYALKKGFFQRLGIELDVKSRFIAPRIPTAKEYKEFLEPKGRSSNNPRLVVLPLALFPNIRSEEWDVIGISGVYYGYALIGKHNDNIPDIKGANQDESRKAIKKLVEMLMENKFRVRAFEKESARFYQMLGLIVSETPLEKPPMVKSTPLGGDALYQKLIEDKADFVIGSAPTRALCEQAGFRIYIDLQDLINLLSQTSRSFEEDIRYLSMHEVWLIDKGLDRAILQKLASVLYYTIDYILRDPEDFVRFIFDRNRNRGSKGDIPIARRFIRNAVAACYKFVPFNLYAQTYLLPHSCDFFRNGHNGLSSFDISGVYKSLMKSLHECEAELENFTKDPLYSKNSSVSNYIKMGCRHRQIYNYGEATTFFHKAKKLLKPGE